MPVVLAQVMNEPLSGFSRAEWESLKGMLGRMLVNAEAQRATEPAPAPSSARPARHGADVPVSARRAAR